jgi:hypothetical protein
MVAASLLKLLRADMEKFYGPESIESGSVNAPLLTALGICTGLELLAKYWSGCPDIKASTVSCFLTTVVGLSAMDAEIILQFRNSLAHGYSLSTRRRKDNKPFTYALNAGGSSASALISNIEADHYVINLWAFKRKFKIAISQCKKAIANDQKRLGEFQVCMRNLGEVSISQ